VGGKVWSVGKVALWTLYANVVANLELGDVTGDVSLLVGLDEKVKVALVLITAEGV
jgi:hypothetical protein